jgi:hypothetical protein
MKSMKERLDVLDDITVSVDQDTVIVDHNEDVANDDDLPKVEIEDVTPTTDEPEEEEKIDLSQPRRSTRKRKRGGNKEYINGDELSSS